MCPLSHTVVRLTAISISIDVSTLTYHALATHQPPLVSLLRQSKHSKTTQIIYLAATSKPSTVPKCRLNVNMVSLLLRQGFGMNCQPHKKSSESVMFNPRQSKDICLVISRDRWMSMSTDFICLTFPQVNPMWLFHLRTRQLSGSGISTLGRQSDEFISCLLR